MPLEATPLPLAASLAGDRRHHLLSCGLGGREGVENWEGEHWDLYACLILWFVLHGFVFLCTATPFCDALAVAV